MYNTITFIFYYTYISEPGRACCFRKMPHKRRSSHYVIDSDYND